MNSTNITHTLLFGYFHSALSEVFRGQGIPAQRNPRAGQLKMVSVWAFELKLRGSKKAHSYWLWCSSSIGFLPNSQLAFQPLPYLPLPLLTSHLACELNVPTRTFADLLLLKALQSTVIHAQKSREALATASTPPCPYLSTPTWRCLPHLLQILP